MLRFHKEKLGSQIQYEKKIIKGNSPFVTMMLSILLCGCSIDVGWNPSELCSYVQNNDVTLALRGYEKVYFSQSQVPGESMA